MSAFSIHPRGDSDPLQASGSGQTRQPRSRQNDINRLSAPHDGLPKTHLPAFHRSSTPSVTREGKENGYSHQQRDPRSSQPPMNILRNQRSGNVSDMARREEERRNQAAWSPRRGRREEMSKAAPPVATAGDTFQPDKSASRVSIDVEDVNRDFERLLVSFEICYDGPSLRFLTPSPHAGQLSTVGYRSLSSDTARYSPQEEPAMLSAGTQQPHRQRHANRCIPITTRFR